MIKTKVRPPRLAVLTLLVAASACSEPPDGEDVVAEAESESGGSEGETTAATDSEETTETGDLEPPGPPDGTYDVWHEIELPDTYCGNQSQYKFFVNWHEGSDDLLVMMEPGGACWDFPGCNGTLGKLGVANLDGIPDNHMDVWSIHSPLVRRDGIGNPMQDWNMVFIPYCTGDTHIGSNEVVYQDPDGVLPDLEFWHVGWNNNQIISAWLAETFPSTERLFMGGCSAGGVGSTPLYHTYRDAIAPGRGYLMADSGPLFPNSTNSAPLHAVIRESWNLDAVIADVVADFPDAVALDDDLGYVNRLLAEHYPDDRLSVTFFIRDYNFSRYSYERFFEPIDEAAIHQLFLEDTQLLMAEFDQYPNLGYFLPYYRPINDSHCTTIIDFGLTNIGEMDVGDYAAHVLDDSTPLQSHVDIDGSLAP
jgi:hypothetical protein